MKRRERRRLERRWRKSTERTVPSVSAMRRYLALAIALAACSPGSATSTTAGTLPPPSTLVVTTTTIPRLAPLPLCEPPAYFPTVLPAGVLAADEQGEFPADRYTAIEGTSTVVFVDEESQPKVVLVRGSLPPDEWAGRTVRIEVNGFDAALGTMPDGAWAVAWTETSARCDQYSVIIYPPSSREEAEVVAGGLER